MKYEVTGGLIKRLREKKSLTQEQLGKIINVSDKTISKWETAKGLPDVTLLEPLAKALGVSVMELMAGERMANQNPSANMRRCRFYVCPVCGNVLHAMGEAAISCCGQALTPLVSKSPDEAHALLLESVEDEQLVTLSHPMAKEHYISFIAFVSYDRMQLVKLYPEGEAQTRMYLRGGGELYAYCNRHGLIKQTVSRIKKE